MILNNINIKIKKLKKIIKNIDCKKIIKNKYNENILLKNKSIISIIKNTCAYSKEIRLIIEYILFICKKRKNNFCKVSKNEVKESIKSIKRTRERIGSIIFKKK